MSTSFFEGITLAAASVYGALSAEVGPCITRDVVVNNLSHYADEYAQVRVAWGGHTVTGATGYITPDVAVANVHYRLVTFGPFPLALRADGTGYRLRVRIAGSSSNGHSVTFTAVLSPAGSSAASVGGRIPVSDASFQATTTSTTAAWRSGTSRGDLAYTTQIVVPPETTLVAATATPTLTDLAGNNTAAPQALFELAMYGFTENTGSTPRLVAVYAAEYVGD